MVSSLGTDPKPAFPLPPRGGSRTCRRPLCCPPRPPGRTAASPSTRAGARRRGAWSSAALRGRRWAHCPHQVRAPPRVPSRPGLARGRERRGGEGGRGEGPRHCGLGWPGSPASPAPPRILAGGGRVPGQPLHGPAGRPLVPTRCSEAPQLIFRGSPRGPNYSLQSFKPEDVKNS